MMDFNNEHHKDLRELIEKALDGTISAEELVRLESTIINDPVQRRYYCEYLHLTIGLMRLCNSTKPPLFPENDTFDYESLWRALLLEEERAPAVPAPELPEQRKDKQPQVKVRIPPTKTLWLNVAAVCVVTVFLFLISAHFYQILVPREVATVSKSLHINKAENHTLSVGTRLTNQKDPIRLNSGVLEILFDGGAQVLLEAPAVFRLTSEKLMVLHTGQLYAKVPDYAQGFTIETPRSRIIDMGTEFGVQVAQDGTSDLHMFKGKAAFIPDTRRRTSRSLTLTAGQAKRVDARGRVQDIQLQDQFFVRYFNTDTDFIWRGQRLSLADLVGHGNGLGNGQANVYVDPLHGYTKVLYTVDQDNNFHELPANPFIDGLFIPDGRDKQVVSSQAHVFAACPPTNGESYANLGANPYQGLYSKNQANTLIIRVVDPSSQGTPAFVLADNTYIVTGTETGIELMPDDWSQNKLGTGTWVHFKLGTPVILAANKQYGFDVTVTSGNTDFSFETAGVAKDSYAGGSAYSTGTKNGSHSLYLDEVYEGDHTFVVELSQIGTIEPTQGTPQISYSARAPDINPSSDIFFLGESQIDNQNVGGSPGQTYSGDNDHATYIASDRRGLGQTFITGSHPDGYLMKGFWLKNVRYTRNLSRGNGTWWYTGTQERNGIVQFNGQEYGSRKHPCIMMHANLGITFDLDALRTLCPDIIVSRFVSQIGVADFEETVGCNADFWVLVDGDVRVARRHVTVKGRLNDISVALTPADRFLTLATTDGGDVDRLGAYQRSYTCDWCVFVEPAFILEKEEGTTKMLMP